MSKSLPVVFLACKVFDGIVQGKQGVTNTFLDYGLHSVPKQLKVTVQEQVDAIEEPSLIVLGYGLCGNGLNDIDAGIHTLVIPKADDCVSMFMGSRQRYLKEFRENPGTYYLTKGWLEVGSDPLSEYEKYVEKYGEDTAVYLMETQYQHYKRLVFVAHSQEDLETYRPRALEVAAYCERFGMVYEEYLGSEDFIDQISDAVNTQNDVSSEFIVVQPGGTLKQAMFLAED
ncbi:MAG: DUF1638 domain-containing protein [Chloroflexi bacterium]|nr:MAG: DUF1638 domain-containing protein [Chloroflexota bacterium]